MHLKGSYHPAHIAAVNLLCRLRVNSDKLLIKFVNPGIARLLL